MPSGYIKNTGADLPEAQVSGLLAQWKQSRQNRSTAYLTSTLSYETTGFSPKDMMYNEAQQYLATQVARAMNVPAYASLIVLDRTTTMYLLEDKSLGIVAGTANAVTVTTSWDEMS